MIEYSGNKNILKKRIAFTLVEILTTIAIVGVVSVLVIPIILVNVNERAWEAQKRALLARMSQAIAQVDYLADYNITDKENTEMIKTSASGTFITNILSKIYKIGKVCDKDNMSNCGITNEIITMNKTPIPYPKTFSELNPELLDGMDAKYNIDIDAASFLTLNGEGITVFYNPFCGSNTYSFGNSYMQNKMCVNMIVDLNGHKGPNIVGKDITFMTIATAENIEKKGTSYPIDGQTDAASLCKKQVENLRIPNLEEMGSMYINKALINLDDGEYWTGTVISSGEDGFAWAISTPEGAAYRESRGKEMMIRCIKE